MSEFLTALLTMTLGGSLMALLLLALRPLLRRKGRHTALYYLYLPVLLRFLLPLPGLFSPLGTPVPESEAFTLTSPAPEIQNEAILTVEETFSAPETSYITAETPSVPELTPMPPAEATEKDPSPSSVGARRTLSPSALLTLLYLCGASASLLWNLGSYARFTSAVRRSGCRAPESASAMLRSLAPEKNIGLLCSPAVPVPLLMGLRRQLIVLPDAVPGDDDLRDVLRHELTHSRRRDLPYKWLMMLTLCVHWFNPLLYVLRRSMADDCELSCDAAMAASMTPNEKQHYGEMLIRLSAAPLSPALPAATLSEGRASLEKRLRSLMVSAPSRRSTAAVFVLCALLLCGCGALLGGEGREKAEETTPVFFRDEGGFWSTDGNTWYAPGQYVWGSDDFWNTGETSWFDNAWWTTDGNVFYSGNGWTTDGNSVHDLSYYTPPRDPPFATDGNVNPAYCEEVTVSTAEELLSALRSNVCITLQPGTYDLSRAAVDFYPGVYWTPDSGSQQMRCSNLYSVSLRGATGDPGDVTILLSEEAPAGLLLDGCIGLNFQGLTFAAESGADAACDLLYIRNGHNVYIGNCAFSSAGGSAVRTEGCRFVTLSSCAFKGTVKGNVEHRDGSFLLLENCNFSGIDGAHPSFIGCSNVHFRTCDLDGALMHTVDFPEYEP